MNLIFKFYYNMTPVQKETMFDKKFRLIIIAQARENGLSSNEDRPILYI